MTDPRHLPDPFVQERNLTPPSDGEHLPWERLSGCGCDACRAHFAPVHCKHGSPRPWWETHRVRT